MSTATGAQPSASRREPGLVPYLSEKEWQSSSLLLIGEALGEVERTLRETLSSPSPAFDEVLSYVGRLSGKRLRPCLTLLSALASGGCCNRDAVRLAAVVELVHTATLVHDDMLDDADLRRHHPTIHVRWDHKTAILCGDWLFTKAYGLANMGESTIPGRWIAEAACQLCEAELHQNRVVGDWHLSEKDYFEILRGKTGVLCGVSCRLGSWTGSTEPSVWEACASFGSDLGVAFQLHDDWLDYWGCSTTTGKPDHADLMANKMTLPLIYLFDQLDAPEQERVVSILQEDREKRIPMIHEYLERVHAELYIRRTASRIAERAKRHLSALPSSPARDALASLADLAVSRFK